MPTESSAVASLIRHVHSRRLDTDPSDYGLFGRTSVAQPPARIAPLRPLALGTNPPPTQKQYPTLPRAERRRWPLVVSAVFACGMGVGGAAYVAEVLELRGPARHAAATVAPSPITPMPTPAPAATPTPAPTATPMTVEPLPAPAPAPVAAETTTTEPAKAAPAKRTKSKRAVTKRSKRSRAKEASVDATLPAELTPHAAAPAPAAAEPAPVPTPTPAPPRKQKQAADTENPL